VHWEGSRLVSIVSIGFLGIKTPLFPVLYIKLVIFGEFVRRKGAFSESKYSLSESSEGRVGLVNFFSEFISEINLLAVDKELGASS